MNKLVRSIFKRAGYRLVPTVPAHDVRLLDLTNVLRRMSGAEPAFKNFLGFCMLHFEQSRSQLMQDLFVDFVLQKTGGAFLEFGAHDGVTLSNSHYLERAKAWRGVLAEPTPGLQASIRSQRPLAILETRCVFSKTGDHLEFMESRSTDRSTIRGFEHADEKVRFQKSARVYKVETVSLDDLIKTHFAGRDVDYVSIDTEGSEWEILRNYAFAGNPAVFTIEHNFSPNRGPVADLMRRHGYVNVFPECTDFDDWFVREDVYRRRFAS